MQKPCFPWILKRKKMMLQKWGIESCQIIKFDRRGWITIMSIRTTSAVREKSRQTMNGYNGLWTEALFVEVHRASCRTAKKNENDSKIIIRKIKLRLKKQRNNKKKGTGQFQNLKWFLCLPFLPCFPRVSLHQSSTNILPQMIYQMFAKAEVSTGSYTLSMTLCGNYSQLNINIEQSLYQKVEEIIVPLFWKAQHWIQTELNTSHFFKIHALWPLSACKVSQHTWYDALHHPFIPLHCKLVV